MDVSFDDAMKGNQPKWGKGEGDEPWASCPIFLARGGGGRSSQSTNLETTIGYPPKSHKTTQTNPPTSKYQIPLIIFLIYPTTFLSLFLPSTIRDSSSLDSYFPSSLSNIITPLISYQPLLSIKTTFLNRNLSFSKILPPSFSTQLI